MKIWMILALALNVLFGCQSSKDDTDILPNMTKPAPNPRGDNNVYQYKTGKTGCEDTSGKPAASLDFLGECGLIANVDLSGRDFTGHNFKGAYFKNVKLNQAKLVDAQLSGATFVNTDMSNADLSRAALDMSAFVKPASLHGANISSASFVGVNAEDKITLTSLDDVDLADATFDLRTMAKFNLDDATGKLKMKLAGSVKTNTERVTMNGKNVDLDILSAKKFSGNERGFIAELFNVFASMRFNLPVDHLFNKMFKSISGNSVMEKMQNYATERLHYFAKRATNSNDSGVTIAANPSADWLAAVWNSYFTKGTGGPGITATRPIKEVPYNNTTLKFDRPMLGYVELGDPVFDFSVAYVRKIASILHESRHSDCSQLPSGNELLPFFSDGDTDSLAVYRKCHHLHVKCPAGHALAGVYACDAHAWGPYTVNAILMNAVANHCENCSSSEKILALALEKDARSRILVMDKLLNGTAGDADMSNITFQP